MSTGPAPRRSPLAWYGGKGKIAPWIVSFLPPHEEYLETHAGSLAVLFAKEPAVIETINDRDGGVTHFYRVLRDPALFARFALLAELTPYAREEYEHCRDTWHEEDDPVRRAWSWFVVARQAFGGGGMERGRRIDWKHSVSSRAGGGHEGHEGSGGGDWGYSVGDSCRATVSPAVQRYLSAVARQESHARLQRVQVECRDWRAVLARYASPRLLAYVDPPYVHATRTGHRRYAHEMTEEDHRDLVAALLATPAMVALSGYAHPLYAPLEEAGWERSTRNVPVNVALVRDGLRRVESLWRNPAAVVAWEGGRLQPQLFAVEDNEDEGER